MCAAPVCFGQSKVLIVNSDASVRKYLVVQTAFREAFDFNCAEIDLAAKDAGEDALEKAIEVQDPDLFYCIGSKAYDKVYRLAKDERIVLSSAINWERFPVGEKTRVVATELPSGMQLTMFRYFFPDVKTIGLVYSRAFQKQWVAQAKANAADVGIEVKTTTVGRFRSLERALHKLLPEVDALWLIPDPKVISGVEDIALIFGHCEAQKKPVFACQAAFAERGAAMAISPDVPTIGRQAAAFALDLLADEESEEKSQTPAGSEITINLKTVKACGLELNSAALDSVNRIIKQ